MTTAYTIRDISDDLHRQAKATAALEGITLRELILKALEVYVKQSKERRDFDGRKS